MPGTAELPVASVAKGIIPADCKEQILKELRMMGVSRATLFPDLDTACRDICREFSIEQDRWQRDGRGPARCGTAYLLAVPEMARSRPWGNPRFSPLPARRRTAGEPSRRSASRAASHGQQVGRATRPRCEPPNAQALPAGWLRFPVIESSAGGAAVRIIGSSRRSSGRAPSRSRTHSQSVPWRLQPTQAGDSQVHRADANPLPAKSSKHDCASIRK